MQKSPPPKSPTYGGPVGHAIFHRIIKWFGPIPAYVILAFVIPYYAIFLSQPRKMASHYLRHRFPADSDLKRFFRTIVFLYKFGQVLIDQAAMGILGPEKFTIDFPDRAKLHKLSTRDKGMVLLTSHIGNWQTTMATMDHLEKTIYFHLQIDEHMAGRFFFDLAGERNKIRIISPTGFMGGFLEMTKVLNEGQSIAIMGDRAWGARTQEHTFLGEKAAFPISPYRLALASNANLIIFLTARTSKLAVHIECISLLEDDTELLKNSKTDLTSHLLGRYVEALENFIQKYPYMWFNIFDFWSKGKKSFEMFQNKKEMENDVERRT